MARWHTGDALYRVVLDVSRVEDGTVVRTVVRGPFETLRAARRVASKEHSKRSTVVAPGIPHATYLTTARIERAFLDWSSLS